MGIDRRKMFVNLEQYGNTSAGSIPLALDEAVQQGRIHTRQQHPAVRLRRRPGLGHGPVAVVDIQLSRGVAETLRQQRMNTDEAEWEH